MSTLATIEAIEKGKRMSQLTKDITDLENRLKYGAVSDPKAISEIQQGISEKKEEYEKLKKTLFDLNASGEDEEDQD